MRSHLLDEMNFCKVSSFPAITRISSCNKGCVKSRIFLLVSVCEELVYHSIVSGFVSSCDVENINMYKQNYIVYHEGKYLTRKIKELMELAKEIGYRREQTEIADL